MLNIPDREKGFLVTRGDRLEPGISIGNSEVGLSSLTLPAESIFHLQRVGGHILAMLN